jgi:hypothetical protein
LKLGAIGDDGDLPSGSPRADQASTRLPADRPALRINLVSSQLIGLVMARYVIRAEPLASLAPEAVVALVAPTLQRHLVGALEASAAE